MGEPGAALKTPGSREVNLPGAESNTRGQGEVRRPLARLETAERGGAEELEISPDRGGFGGPSVEEIEQRHVVWVRYVEEGKEPVVIKLKGDPLEVQQRVVTLLGIAINPVDLVHDEIMEERRLRGTA